MNRIKKLRTERQITQKVFADILRTTQQNISRYEHDISTVPTSTLITVSNYFSVSVDYLLGLSDVKEIAREGDSLKAFSKYDDLLERIKALDSVDQKMIRDLVTFYEQRKNV